MLQEQSKSEEAIKAYTKAIKLKPDFAEAYINLGNEVKDHDKFAEAIEAYKNAILIDPDIAYIQTLGVL